MASCLPYFFEEINGDAVTVNGNRYRQMIQEYLLPEIGDNNTEKYFFQTRWRYSSYSKNSNGNVKNNYFQTD